MDDQPTSRAPIRFDDGAAYEQFMGVWSRLAGEEFVRWLAPPANARWADVGCGNGAFTALLLERCAAAEVHGIDPSEEQIAFARTRFTGLPAHFERGDAMALPWSDASFDAATMALVIFFVPDPPKSVAEMARVVRPGGSVSAYAWDIPGGGFPYAMLQEEMAAIGAPPAWPPSVDASRLESMRSLWQGAGLVDVDTHVITVERTYDDFESFWAIARTGPRLLGAIAGMDDQTRERFRAGVRARLKTGADGRITCSARANAVRGRVPPRR
jgi:SAM-dependent methyltransferase